MSLAEQMGNIGSEVGRAGAWRDRGNQEYAQMAFFRALELFGLTLADERWRGAKRREIARAREALCDAFGESDKRSTALSSLNGYFSHFAIMARARKGS